jgi:hypothetical protein
MRAAPPTNRRTNLMTFVQRFRATAHPAIRGRVVRAARARVLQYVGAPYSEPARATLRELRELAAGGADTDTLALLGELDALERERACSGGFDRAIGQALELHESVDHVLDESRSRAVPYAIIFRPSPHVGDGWTPTHGSPASHWDGHAGITALEFDWAPDEHRLRSALETVMPCVTLSFSRSSDPSYLLLGEEWIRRVDALVREAFLIVVVAPELSEAVLLELEHIVARGRAGQSVLIVPDPSEWDDLGSLPSSLGAIGHDAVTRPLDTRARELLAHFPFILGRESISGASDVLGSAPLAQATQVARRRLGLHPAEWTRGFRGAPTETDGNEPGE